MSVSLPSAKIGVIDIPDVKDFKARFVYEFFTTDETHNDTSVAPKNIRSLPAESFDAERIDDIRRVVPRYVRFDFSPPAISRGILQGNEFSQSPAKSDDRLSIAKNIARIQMEEEFSGRLYTGLEFQDNNLDMKLFTLVSGSIAKRAAAKNRSVQRQIDENRQNVINSLTDEHSLLDAAKALADETSEGVSNNVIVNSLNQIDALKLQFIDESSTRVLTDQTFDRVKNVTMKGQISNKLVGRVVKNIVDDPMSQFADEFATLQARSGARQLETISRANPNIIRREEYETSFRALLKRPIDAHDAPASSKIIGYIIEKSELTADNQLKKHPPIIIENGEQTTAVDLRVAYGRTYVYTIRTVAQMRVRATHDDADEVVLATGLIQSRRSPRVFVTCTETVPPPCVTDFNVIWNYTKSAPMLIWSFPPNPQRDIKRFQVFKRTSIYEPFQLIQELDFDDSDVRFDSGETPAPELSKKLTSPISNFIDEEFVKDSRTIYAICCIDAHGMSSNYSMQLEVSFDPFKNRIKKALVSNAGAPKSYPNMALLHDTFVDTMRSSDNTRVKVIFDPEFLDVLDSDGNNLNLIASDKDGVAKYKLQIINTDIQKQEVVDITIRDTTKSVKRSNVTAIRLHGRTITATPKGGR